MVKNSEMRSLLIAYGLEDVINDDPETSKLQVGKTAGCLLVAGKDNLRQTLLVQGRLRSPGHIVNFFT